MKVREKERERERELMGSVDRCTNAHIKHTSITKGTTKLHTESN